MNNAVHQGSGHSFFIVFVENAQQATELCSFCPVFGGKTCPPVYEMLVHYLYSLLMTPGCVLLNHGQDHWSLLSLAESSQTRLLRTQVV